MNVRIPVLLAILAATISLGCRKSTQVSGGMAPTITNSEQVTMINDYEKQRNAVSKMQS